MPSRTGSSSFVTSAFRHSFDSCSVSSNGASCRKKTSLKIMDDKAKIQEAIKTQGEVVRKLKAEKASKEQVGVGGGGRWPSFSFNMTERHNISLIPNLALLLRYSLFDIMPTIIYVFVLYLRKSDCRLTFWILLAKVDFTLAYKCVFQHECTVKETRVSLHFCTIKGQIHKCADRWCNNTWSKICV